jgi:WhiB family redox-sensing transcriptional regulator
MSDPTAAAVLAEMHLLDIPGPPGLPPELDWQIDGLCAQADPDAWYPEKGMSAGPAKQICRSCPVRQECLEYALATDERWGVWGGLSERERRRVKKNAA